VGAGLERVDEDLEPGRVTRQLEQSHDADDAEELEDVVLLHNHHHQQRLSHVNIHCGSKKRANFGGL